MNIGLSPCPNDTYLFHAWIKGVVGHNMPITPHFADIEQLNQWALTKTFPLIKLSFPCFAKVIKDYQLLPIGAALGFNCGPKIVAKKSFPLTDLPHKTIAIPGKETTAHFLLNQLLPPPDKKIFSLYHEIGTLIKNGTVDCGLIIHESRFTYKQEGFVEIVDLGELWHQQTNAPLPLGGLAIARTLSSTMKTTILMILQESLAHAQNNPTASIDFILHHSQEKDLLAVRKHIETYVTSETACLSLEGMKAIENFLHYRGSTIPCSLRADSSHDWVFPDPTRKMPLE